MSETEIYADMLLECFDISISQHPTGPNGSNRLICEVCITRLRDACNFKKQVLESEKKFVDMVGRGEFRPKVLLYQTQMKTERIMEIEEDGADDSGEVEYLEEDADFVDEELLKNEDYGEASVSEDITVSALAVKGKRGRPKKTAKPEKKAKVAKTEEKPKKAVAKGSEYLSRAHDTEPEGQWTQETRQDLSRVHDTEPEGQWTQETRQDLSRAHDTEPEGQWTHETRQDLSRAHDTEPEGQWTQETRQDLSRAHDTEPEGQWTQETRQDVSRAHDTEPEGQWTQETRQDLSRNHDTEPEGQWTQETRQDLSRAHDTEPEGQWTQETRQDLSRGHDTEPEGQWTQETRQDLSRAHDTKPGGQWTQETRRRNIESVLLYSNVTPFIWHRGKYRCFYCMYEKRDPNDMLCHFETHDCVNLPVAVKRYTQLRGNADAAIKVEITNLHCKLCKYKKQDLHELIQHLIDDHDVDYDLDIPNCFLPFRLTGKPTCGSCHVQFDLFQYVLLHANKEHLKHIFVCYICGKSFYTERYYSAHLKDYHKEGGYKCEYCDKVFNANSKKALHEQTAHQARGHKCTICDKVLNSLYLRNVHLSKVHEVEERRFKCHHCQRVFPQLNLMLRHVKFTHRVKERVQAVGPPMVNRKHVNFSSTSYNIIHIQNPANHTVNLNIDYEEDIYT